MGGNKRGSQRGNYGQRQSRGMAGKLMGEGNLRDMPL
jgi:hypothetical protein